MRDDVFTLAYLPAAADVSYYDGVSSGINQISLATGNLLSTTSVDLVGAGPGGPPYGHQEFPVVLPIDPNTAQLYSLDAQGMLRAGPTPDIDITDSTISTVRAAHGFIAYTVTSTDSARIRLCGYDDSTGTTEELYYGAGRNVFGAEAVLPDGSVLLTAVSTNVAVEIATAAIWQ